jgi:two-component system, NtrC family, nitrogen regulation sensor histidine kinase NtrY
MNRLRTRLIAVFVLATVVPLGLTLWTTLRLVDSSLELAPLDELKSVTDALQQTGREVYREARESLRKDVADGRIEGKPVAADTLDAGSDEAFVLGGAHGDELHYYVRRDGRVLEFSRPLRVPLKQLEGKISEARRALEVPAMRDVRGGFSRSLILISTGLWLAALGALIFLAARISRPIRELTQGLGRVAAGDLSARVESSGEGEIGEAMVAFNDMTSQMQQAREHLIQVTRVASWQALARKMAHEVKNSLTPIRLTVEEIASRHGGTDPFMEQASQIVTDEITTLEKRVRAFSEFAAEPPVTPSEIDVNSMVEERITFLRAARPETTYQTRLSADRVRATADADLVKGVLTNLLENAAQAAGPQGVVLARTATDGERVSIEVLDSGPGLSEQAKSSLFEPTISFKKGGMGLGLSIARRSAVLCGGDLHSFDGELGGAGFRLVLPREKHGE